MQNVAYPDMCHGVTCCPDDECGVDLNCTFTSENYKNATSRKAFARHLGGVNLGFLDGHVKWWNSEALMQASSISSHPSSGACSVDPGNDAQIAGPLGMVYCDSYEYYPGPLPK
jgi:prepilin-type processing-associated H-X9-DG protein